MDGALSLDNEWLKAMHIAEGYTEVNAELIKHLIQSVKVFDGNRIEVVLNFVEQKTPLEEVIIEMAGDSCE